MSPMGTLAIGPPSSEVQCTAPCSSNLERANENGDPAAWLVGAGCAPSERVPGDEDAVGALVNEESGPNVEDGVVEAPVDAGAAETQVRAFATVKSMVIEYFIFQVVDVLKVDRDLKLADGGFGDDCFNEGRLLIDAFESTNFASCCLELLSVVLLKRTPLVYLYLNQIVLMQDRRNAA